MVEGTEYFGIEIPTRTLEEAIVKTGYYGVFVVHSMYNVDFMKTIDPALVDEILKKSGE